MPDLDTNQSAPIALFGGTFDPVHLGHLSVANEARKALEIKDFRMIPARVPPHKQGTHASAKHRLAMLQLALKDQPGLTIDDRELERDGPSWMVLTLRSLAREYPNAPLLLILGQDTANHLNRWYRWQEILDLAHLVVITRAGEVPVYDQELGGVLAARAASRTDDLYSAHHGKVMHLPVEPIDISSSMVRARLVSNQAIDDLVPMVVADYIIRNGLYASTEAL